MSCAPRGRLRVACVRRVREQDCSVRDAGGSLSVAQSMEQLRWLVLRGDFQTFKVDFPYKSDLSRLTSFGTYGVTLECMNDNGTC